MVWSKFRALCSMICIFISLIGAAFIANICQLLSYIFIRPFSPRRHRKVCLHFSGAFFLCSTFLLEKWSSITFHMHGDRISSAHSHLGVMNHISNVDWLLGLAFLAKFGYPYPGNAKSVVKASLGHVPLFGSILRFSEFLFLTRSWNADRDVFLRSLLKLRRFSTTCAPMWFTLYPEGTRLTPDKLQASQAFAVSRNIQPLDNVLFPRFKAFTSILGTLRDEFDAVVDATFMFDGTIPTVNTVLAGNAKVAVHIYVKHYPIEKVPKGEEELEEWLLDRWREKDQMIARFKADPASLGKEVENYFPEPHPSLIPIYSLVAVYLVGTAATMYIFSTIPNGLYIFGTTGVGAVILTAIVTALNLKPSRKGSSSSRSSIHRPTTVS